MTLTGTVGEVVKVVPGADGSAQAVSLSPAEVLALGDGTVQVSAAQTDEHGNLGASSSPVSFVLDTAAPVAGIEAEDDVASFDVVTDADAAGSVTVTVSFNEAMDTSVIPILTLDPDVTSSLAPVEVSEGEFGEWQDDGRTFVAEYTVTDAGVDENAVRIGVSGAKDVAGNLQADYTAETEFNIDTKNPSTVGAPLVSGDGDDGVITDADADSTLTVSFSFDEPMDTATAPVVGFTPDGAIDWSATLTSQSGSWTDAHTFVATATIVDVGDEETGLDVDAVTIDITGAKDAAGNPQEDHNATVGLEVDTLNPTVELVKSEAFAEDDVFSEDDLTNGKPVVELQDLPTDLKLAEVFIIGANAEQPVDASSLVPDPEQQPVGVVYQQYASSKAYDGENGKTIDVKLSRDEIDNLGQDGTDVYVRVTDDNGNETIRELGSLLIHTGTKLDEDGTVGLGEVVQDGYTLGTTFIPSDEDFTGDLKVEVHPETGKPTVTGDKINLVNSQTM